MQQTIVNQLYEVGISPSLQHKLELVPAAVLKHALYRSFGIGHADSNNRITVVNNFRKSFLCQLAYILIRNKPYNPMLDFPPHKQKRYQHQMTFYTPIS